MNFKDLKRFCSRDNGKSYLKIPFTVDGKTYASDGRIALRVPLVESANDVRSYPGDFPARGIVGHFGDDEAIFFEKLTLEYPKLSNGKEKCPHCIEHDCPDCRCLSKCNCDEGFVKYCIGSTVWIKEVPLNPYYISKIMDFFNPEDLLFGKGKLNDRIYFKCGDVSGVLMGLDRLFASEPIKYYL